MVRLFSPRWDATSRSERQQLEQQVQNDPTRLEARLALIELLIRQRDFAAAESAALDARSVAATDSRVVQQLEQLRLADAEHRLEIARRLRETGGSQYAPLEDQLQQESLRIELEVCVQRAQREPGNAKIGLALADRLQQLGKYAEAAQVLRPIAVANAAAPGRWAAEAALQLGECHQRLREFDEAQNWYRAAREAALANDQPTLAAQATYRSARLTAAQGNLNLAIDLLAQTLRANPDHPQAQHHLDKLRQIRDKGGLGPRPGGAEDLR